MTDLKKILSGMTVDEKIGQLVYIVWAVFLI